MELCRQYGFIFICEILLVLNCESYPSNLHCDPAAYYIYAAQKALNTAKKILAIEYHFVKSPKSECRNYALIFNKNNKCKPKSIKKKIGYFKEYFKPHCSCLNRMHLITV